MTALAEELGFNAVLVPFTLAGLLTGLVSLAQPVAPRFDERNP
jgi:hypothetical protein